MSTEQNKAIVHRAFEELFNQRHVEVMDELWAKEFIHHWSGQEEGRATWKESMRLFPPRPRLTCTSPSRT